MFKLKASKVLQFVRKIFKLLGIVLLFLIAVLVGLSFYFDSDFSEVRRLKVQIEENLALSLSKLPDLIDRENYGWIEEGGDKALLALSPADCKAIAAVMTNLEKSNEKSEYIDMFTRNNLNPTHVKTWFKSNVHGDFINYALDEKTCNLYRRYHYE